MLGLLHRERKNRFFLFFLIFFIFTGCARNPVTKKLELSFLSVSTEKRLGEEFFVRVDKEDLSQGPFLKEGPAVEYIQRIVDRLSLHYERRGEMPIKAVLSPSAVPNAWAIPGYLNINIGIIPCLENEAQLAFIIGHEMGHIAARHTAQRYTRSVLLDIAVRGVRMYSGEVGGLLGSIAGSLYLASYSRSQERMADDLGIKYINLAGYDPYQASSAMKAVDQCSTDYSKEMGKRKISVVGFIEKIFSDHPGTKERIRRLQEKADRMGKKDFKGSSDFEFVKKWAMERKNVLIKLEKAVYLAQSKRFDKALDIVEDTLNMSEGKGFEREILSKIYALSGYIYLMGKRYQKAWVCARKAYREKKDFYVSYKIAGIAGLRDDSVEGLKVALEAFSTCLEVKETDPDYLDIFQEKIPPDEVCLRGAIIASCKLGHRKECRAYCREYKRKFGTISPDLVRYCFFR